MILATFNFSCCRVIDNTTIYMFKTQVTIIASSCFVSTPWDPTFLLFVLPLRWFESEVSGTFQYLVAFRKEVCLISITSMASSKCWYIHLACLVALGILLILVDLCIFITGGCHCCYVGVWVGFDYGVFRIVGVIVVTSCGGQFSCSTQVILETPLHCFHGTFKCVVL